MAEVRTWADPLSASLQAGLMERHQMYRAGSTENRQFKQYIQ
jgi:hypothetical protein